MHKVQIDARSPSWWSELPANLFSIETPYIRAPRRRSIGEGSRRGHVPHGPDRA